MATPKAVCRAMFSAPICTVIFDTGELTEKLVEFLCKRKGIRPESAALIPMEQYRQQQFDRLADGVRSALDLDALYAAMGLNGRSRT
mgnify:CR=1 FL=1